MLAQSVLLPEPASNHAEPVDFALAFINFVTVIFFVLIIALMVFFAWRFRRKSPTQRAESQTSHNTPLELAWTIPPFLIVLYIFYLGITGYLQIQTVPPDAYTVTVTAQKWAWMFTHPNGAQSPNLHVPANEPVKLLLQSQDVIHSLYIPAFRVKKDAVPGRFNFTWFIAKEPTPGHDSADIAEAEAGGHILYCTEYCGTNHSTMLAKVVVHPEGWRPEAMVAPTEASVEFGELQFKLKGCASCHQIVPGGPQLAGPSFAGGIFGKTETLATGQQIVVDDEYLRSSIVNPAQQIVQGYPPVMPPMPLTEVELESLILYIKSLGTAGAAQ